MCEDVVCLRLRSRRGRQEHVGETDEDHPQPGLQRTGAAPLQGEQRRASLVPQSTAELHRPPPACRDGQPADLYEGRSSGDGDAEDQPRQQEQHGEGVDGSSARFLL